MIPDHLRLQRIISGVPRRIRQQTVSEWETGAYLPTRASAKALGHLAERIRFASDED